MNKRDLSERDICTKYITPAVVNAGWDIQWQIREKVGFTKGRIIVRGKFVTRDKAQRVDYILYYKPNIPIALIEAKDNNNPFGGGMQQAIKHAGHARYPICLFLERRCILISRPDRTEDLGAKTVIYMPIHVHGALFSAGDGHATQGHGEVDGTAIEIGLRGRFQFFVRKDMRLKWPRAETSTHWIVMGKHEELDQAMKMSVHESIDFIVGRFAHLTPEESYLIASVVADYHVTPSS